MNWDPTARGIRVLSPSRDDNAEDTSPHISYLANTAHTIESRLLHLIKECAGGGLPLEDFVGELSLLSKDVQRCYRQVADIEKRRDLRFNTRTQLQEIDQRCVWLVRKIHAEQVFFRKLHLERKLRSLISAEAADVYEELLDVDDQDREYLTRDDAEVRKSLLEETS